MSGGGASVAVVGAGLGGLSAAIRLAAAGCSVHVYDRQDGPGGKAFSERIGPYRFDTGPSLVTMPWVFEELWETAGERLSDSLHLVPLEIICKYFWNDGMVLRAFADRQRLLREVERVTAEPAEHLEAFFSYSRKIYDTAAELFLFGSLHEAELLASRRFWKSILHLGAIDALRTMDRANGSFFRHPRLRQLFNRYATYNGSNPYQTPATLNIIPHVEYDGGGYAVAGGVYAIPSAMEALARRLGVTFFYAREVERILTAGRRVTGIRVDGEEIAYDAVVSNADVTPTYNTLLADADAPLARRYRRLEPSSSGLVFYWGMNRRFDELEVNNIFFSDDYRSEFDDIFRRHRAPAEPTIYINITSKVTPEDAPAEGENWFILVNAPADSGQNWQVEAERTREVVLRRLERVLDKPVGAHIAAEGMMTPRDIARKTGSNRGSLYGIASNSRSAAFRRHRNRSTRYRGLYFCGGSAHPGGGMPLAVLSGRIAARLLLAHNARGR